MFFSSVSKNDLVTSYNNFWLTSKLYSNDKTFVLLCKLQYVSTTTYCIPMLLLQTKIRKISLSKIDPWVTTTTSVTTSVYVTSLVYSTTTPTYKRTSPPICLPSCDTCWCAPWNPNPYNKSRTYFTPTSWHINFSSNHCCWSSSLHIEVRFLVDNHIILYPSERYWWFIHGCTQRFWCFLWGTENIILYIHFYFVPKLVIC